MQGQNHPGGSSIQISYRDFHHPVRFGCLGWLNRHGEAPFHRFVQILKQFLEGPSLGGATRDRGDLGLISTFLGFMDDYLYLHDKSASW